MKMTLDSLFILHITLILILESFLMEARIKNDTHQLRI